VQNEYDSITQISLAYFTTTKNNKTGLVDINGKVLIPNEYDDISMVAVNRFKTKKNGKFGIYDLNVNQ